MSTKQRQREGGADTQDKSNKFILKNSVRRFLTALLASHILFFIVIGKGVLEGITGWSWINADPTGFISGLENLFMLADLIMIFLLYHFDE